MEAFTSTNLSLEERSTLIWEIEEDLNQFPGEALSVKKKLIQSACLKIATDYPDFKKEVKSLSDHLIENLEGNGTIDIFSINELMESIRWEYEVTPDDAEQLMNNLKIEKQVLNKTDYKKIKAKIALKYEAALMKELNSVKPESISRWIDETKKMGKVISNKVYSRAVAIKKGKTF